MNTEKNIIFVTAILCSQTIFANNSFTESFEGKPHINANFYVFAADVNGSLSEKNIKYDVDQPFSDTVKNLDQVYMSYIDFSKGDWGVYIDKQLVKTSKDEQVLHIPLALKTKLDQTSYGIYYQAYKSPTENKLKKPKVIFEPTIGVHHTEAKATLAALGLTKQADIHWNEFFWGARFRYNFDSPWNLASEVTIGAENTISTHAYIGYNIPVFSRTINLRAGYRYFKQDYRSGDFHWDINQKGPVIGFNVPIF